MYKFKTIQEAILYSNNKLKEHIKKFGGPNKGKKRILKGIKRSCYACSVTSCLNSRNEENFMFNRDNSGNILNMLCAPCYQHFIFDPPKFNNQEDRTANRKEIRNRIIMPIKDTKIEIILQDLLTKNNIKFEKHKPIFGQPDLFIEPNICIFADGDYWHSLEKSLKRDLEVNTYLVNNDYIVLRLSERTIKNDLNSIWEIIKRFIAQKPLLLIA